MRTSALLLAAALALGFAPVATADHPTEGPGYHHPDPAREIFFSESEAWFTPTTTRVGNVDHENGEWMGWSDTEPADPVGGATAATLYGGFREIFETDGQDKGQFTAEGTVTGYLDSLTLDLYFVGPFQGICPVWLAVDLDVDGLPVLDMDGTGGPVPVTTEPAGNGHVARLKITNVFAQMESFSSGSLDFIGDETTEHTVHLSVQQFPLCTEVVWTYGSADAPSSIVFNRDPSDPSVAAHTEYDVTDPPTRAAG